MEWITGILIGIITTVGGWFSEPQIEPELSGFSDPFLSIQLAENPQNGYILQTDGTDNSWVVNSGGGGGGSGLFSTSTDGQVVYNNTGDAVVIEGTATSSDWTLEGLEVYNGALLHAPTTIMGTLTVGDINATSTSPSTFTGGFVSQASSTVNADLTVGGDIVQSHITEDSGASIRIGGFTPAASDSTLSVQYANTSDNGVDIELVNTNTDSSGGNDSNAVYWLGADNETVGAGFVADGFGTYSDGIGAAAVGIDVWSNHPFWLGTNATPRFYITAGGNVGVATSTPTSLFSVHGNSFFAGELVVTNSGVLNTDGIDLDSGNWYEIGTVRVLHNYGTSNIFAGALAGNTSLTGVGLTGLGPGALTSNTSGNVNTAVGLNSLNKNTTGANNIAVGGSALLNNTTGSKNIGIGTNALSANTTQDNLVAIGALALQDNTTGFNQTAVGINALQNNTSGYRNTAFGISAGDANTAGYENTYLGIDTGFNNTHGHKNVAVGLEALYNHVGSTSVAVGWRALSESTDVASTTALGSLAGYNNTTGDNNIFIGAEADTSDGTISNATAIGYKAIVGVSNALVLGGTGANAIDVGIGTTTPYSKLSIWADGAGTGARVFEITNSASSTLFTIDDSGNATTTGYLAVTSTSATSTFANGLDLSGGCFSINGNCLTEDDTWSFAGWSSTTPAVGSSIYASSATSTLEYCPDRSGNVTGIRGRIQTGTNLTAQFGDGTASTSGAIITTTNGSTSVSDTFSAGTCYYIAVGSGSGDPDDLNLTLRVQYTD